MLYHSKINIAQWLVPAEVPALKSLCPSPLKTDPKNSRILVDRKVLHMYIRWVHDGYFVLGRSTFQVTPQIVP